MRSSIENEVETGFVQGCSWMLLEGPGTYHVGSKLAYKSPIRVQSGFTLLLTLIIPYLLSPVNLYVINFPSKGS